jgi:hypothetical protein
LYSAAIAAVFGDAVNVVEEPPTTCAGIVSTSVLLYPEPAVVDVMLVTVVALAITIVTTNPVPEPPVGTIPVYVPAVAPVGAEIAGITRPG